MMQSFINSPFKIGSLTLSNRLIQGPLAGFSAAPLRQLVYQFIPPAYTVTEMISAYDTLNKHHPESRYLYRAPAERMLCYQLAGNNPSILAAAAKRLEQLGADLIDINCGCPKTKIRKKGAGSALLNSPQQLFIIVATVREAIQIPLTVKIRIHGNEQDIILAKMIEQAGADALIVHGRHWTQDYSTPCNYHQIQHIKSNIKIPVIANGDIFEKESLENAYSYSGCDAFMISRAGCGNPWLFQQLLYKNINEIKITNNLRKNIFLMHLQAILNLENEIQAVKQSKSLIRYYFKNILTSEQLALYYQLNTMHDIINYLNQINLRLD